MTDRIVQVVWKDEGDFGFIVCLTQSDVDHRENPHASLGVPFDPDRQRPYGTREQAQALAQEHGAEFVES